MPLCNITVNSSTLLSTESGYYNYITDTLY